METKKGIGKGNNPNSKKHLKPIKPGEVRNPLGGKTHNPIKKAIRNLTAPGWELILQTVATGTIAELQILADDVNLSALHRGVARAMYNACAEGNWMLLKNIVESILGVAPIKVDATIKSIKETSEEKADREKRVKEQIRALAELGF